MQLLAYDVINLFSLLTSETRSGKSFPEMVRMPIRVAARQQQTMDELALYCN